MVRAAALMCAVFFTSAAQPARAQPVVAATDLVSSWLLEAAERDARPFGSARERTGHQETLRRPQVVRAQIRLGRTSKGRDDFGRQVPVARPTHTVASELVHSADIVESTD
jgi:hypothetical protein